MIAREKENRSRNASSSHCERYCVQFVCKHRPVPAALSRQRHGCEIKVNEIERAFFEIVIFLCRRLSRSAAFDRLAVSTAYKAVRRPSYTNL